MRRLTIIDHDSLAVSTGIRDYFIAREAPVELVSYEQVKSGAVVLAPGVFLWRVSESFHGEAKELQRAIERLGPLINSSEVLELCSRKWLTYERLLERGISTIPTVPVQEFDKRLIRESVARLDFDLRDFSSSKIVVKPDVGAGGRDVYLLDELDELPSSEAWIAQPFYLAGAENQTRIQVTNGKLTGGTHRFPADDTWLNNVSAGGSSSLATVAPELWRLAKEATEAVGAFYAGVDTVTGASGNSYVLELNSSPGVAGLESNGVAAIEHIAEQLFLRVASL